ncbi:hypothetical protein [Corallococcus sp. 4LFB]|uniref:hypothetical protein n=1 Tax=Corallococcus sp. 4LFB TaxID=3383249 RepID=UPI00397518F1
MAALLFLSGATALVYELVWSKYLGNVLGNSGQAHAVVLATFMGGLALGAFVFGRTADRVKSPLALYGVLELGVGLYALAFPYVLGALEHLWLALAPHVPEGLRVAPRLLVSSLSLVVPTLLMGGTLPALVRHFAASLAGVRRELARLYAINSLGAAVGVYVAGTRLVPLVGLSTSAQIAAGLNVFLALAALALAREHPPAVVVGAAPAAEDVAYPRRAVRAALIGVMLSGFTSMLYQVTWIRLLAIVLGASTYAFTLILTAFILGIGLGSFWLMTRKEGGDSLKLYGWTQVGLVLSLCVALPCTCGCRTCSAGRSGCSRARWRRGPSSRASPSRSAAWCCWCPRSSWARRSLRRPAWPRRRCPRWAASWAACTCGTRWAPSPAPCWAGWC